MVTLISKRPKIRHLGIVHALHRSGYITRCEIQRSEIPGNELTDDDVDCMTCLVKPRVTVRFDHIRHPSFRLKGADE